ncbi:MAG: YceI family protein [Myxococcales bacterium]|nr:YceI family protein [Myxococcales bacterium]
MFITLFALTACVEDVAKDKVAAEVEEPPAVEEPAAEEPAAAPAGVAWAVNTETSKVQALGAKVTATHPIMFKDYSGTVHVDEGKVSGVAFTVQMATLESDAEKLTQHLKTADFFDVEKFPTAEFNSSEVKDGSDVEGMTHTVTGTFTIRGETKQITFPAKVEMGEAEVTAETEFALNRKDFKIEYPGMPDDLIQDNVVLTVSLVAPKPEEAAAEGEGEAAGG